jgi:glutaredoxin 3
MSKNVTIYTTNTCAYCETVKRFLNSKGVTYSVVNLDEEEPQVRQKVIEMSGAMTVPIVVVEDEHNEDVPKNITVGWNPGKLAAALAA